jgi:hypothetical protein
MLSREVLMKSLVIAVGAVLSIALSVPGKKDL